MSGGKDSLIRQWRKYYYYYWW